MTIVFLSVDQITNGALLLLLLFFLWRCWQWLLWQMPHKRCGLPVFSAILISTNFSLFSLALLFASLHPPLPSFFNHSLMFQTRMASSSNSGLPWGSLAVLSSARSAQQCSLLGTVLCVAAKGTSLPWQWGICAAAEAAGLPWLVKAHRRGFSPLHPSVKLTYVCLPSSTYTGRWANGCECHVFHKLPSLLSLCLS